MSTIHLEAEQSRRERKKVATRRALQGAALALAAEHGVEHVTVEAISEAADVSARTFFNYFSSKEEALAGDPPVFAELLRAALSVAPPGTPMISTLRSVIHQVAVEAGGRRDELLARKCLISQCPALLPRHLAAFAAGERALAVAIAAHLGYDPDTDLYPSLLAALSGTALRVAFQRWDGGGDHQLEALVDQAFDMLEQGL